MRHYTITINGTAHEIVVDEQSADSFLVTVDGIETQVRLDDHADLAQASITPDIAVGARPTAPVVRDLPAGELGGSPAPAAPSRPAAPPVPVAPTPGPAGAGSGAMTAPMPGVVLSVDTTPGASLARGDLVMVIEAMKMKNEIRADRDGVVAGVPVSAGDQVRYGDVLVTFEG